MRNIVFLISILCTSCFFDSKTEDNNAKTSSLTSALSSSIHSQKSSEILSSSSLQSLTLSQVNEFINSHKSCKTTSECISTYVNHQDYFCCGVVLRLDTKAKLDSVITLLETDSTSKYGECALVDCMDQVASCEQGICTNKYR